MKEQKHKMFMEFVGDRDSDESHSPMPPDFVEEAKQKLSLKDLAIYLGHRRFWVEAAKLPKEAWAVILQDDAHLLGGPVLLRNLLLQAELASKRLMHQPAQFVYLKKCAPGAKFMDTFMNDAQGYAIRADVARDLLEGAPGDRSVAEAIKSFTGGGMCAPLVRSDGAMKTRTVRKLGWSSDDDSADSDANSASPPNMDVMSTHRSSHGAERYQPHQL